VARAFQWWKKRSEPRYFAFGTNLWLWIFTSKQLFIARLTCYFDLFSCVFVLRATNCIGTRGCVEDWRLFENEWILGAKKKCNDFRYPFKKNSLYVLFINHVVLTGSKKEKGLHSRTFLKKVETKRGWSKSSTYIPLRVNAFFSTSKLTVSLSRYDTLIKFIEVSEKKIDSSIWIEREKKMKHGHEKRKIPNE